MVVDAVERLQIDARATGEVRRLSGGNQQKVTIARWVAGGVQTMLCFDPTRGIDIGTKQQIYVLLRDLAEAGAAVLIYTSELKEVQLVCDRAIVIFGGEIVAELAGADADEASLLRAAYNLRADAELPESAAGAAIEEAIAQADEGGSQPIARMTPWPAPLPTLMLLPRDREVSATASPIEGARLPAGRRDRGLGAPECVDAEPARAAGRPAGLHQADPAAIRADPRPGPRHLRPPARAGRRRPGGHRHQRRDRPVDRVDDGAHQRRCRLPHGQPVRRRPGSSSSWPCWASVSCSAGSTGQSSSAHACPDIVVTLAMSFVWAGFALLVRSSPGRRSRELAAGPGCRAARQRMDPAGGRRPDRRGIGHLVPARAVEARPVDVCRSAATASPRSGAGFPSVAPSSSPTRHRPVRGVGRPVAHGQHRDRDPDPGTVHASERRGGRARRRQPGRRPRRRVRTDRRRRRPPADPDRHELPEPRFRTSPSSRRASSSSASSCSAASSSSDGPDA